MRVLLGGCGWLGTALGIELLRRGHGVVGVRRDAAACQLLAEIGIEPLALDLTAAGAAQRLPLDIDAVIACQSAAAGTPEAYRAAYLDAAGGLLDHADQGGEARYVYTGSTGVFGQSGGEQVDESTAPDPAGPTARILVEAERRVLERAGIVVRLSGLYGPGRYGAVDRVRRGQLALGPGDDTWMNWCHRDDAVQVVVAALERGRPGAVYHASDAHPVRRADFVRWVAGRLSIPPSTGAASTSGNRRGANRRISGGRTRRELGLELRFPSFREGLGEVLPPPGPSASGSRPLDRP